MICRQHHTDIIQIIFFLLFINLIYNFLLRFMSHVRHKIENEWKENDNVNDFNICNHCYRHYSSPFHLQCHIETVHATVPAASKYQYTVLEQNN